MRIATTPSAGDARRPVPDALSTRCRSSLDWYAWSEAYRPNGSLTLLRASPGMAPGRRALGKGEPYFPRVPEHLHPRVCWADGRLVQHFLSYGFRLSLV